MGHSVGRLACVRSHSAFTRCKIVLPKKRRNVGSTRCPLRRYDSESYACTCKPNGWRWTYDSESSVPIYDSVSFEIRRFGIACYRRFGIICFERKFPNPPSHNFDFKGFKIARRIRFRILCSQAILNPRHANDTESLALFTGNTESSAHKRYGIL